MSDSRHGVTNALIPNDTPERWCGRGWWRTFLTGLLSLSILSAPLSASAAEKPPGKPLLHPGFQGQALATALVSGAVRPNAGFATQNLAGNDDDSTGLIPIGFSVNFGGQGQTDLYVNNNGNVTFGTSMSTYTPYSLGSSGVPLIAPFFADVDTRPAGSGVVTYGNDTVDGHTAFGVNYRNVGYYSSHVDKLNSFQLVLIDRSDISIGDFDIEFNYDTIAWETGDVSGGQDGFGGTSARAGFGDGTGSPSGWLELAGSGSSRALLDGGVNALASHSLSSTQAGRYVFHIRSRSAAGLRLLDENDANIGVAVSSAAAEGATRVRVRCVSPAPGVVSLVYDGGTPSSTPSGAFVPAPGSIGGLGNLTLQRVGAEYQADAIYTVPEGLVDEVTHDVYFRGVYLPGTGGPQTLEPQTLQLKRPPVILAHGLWSYPETWAESGAWGVLKNAGFDVRRFNYRDSNADHVSVNAGNLFYSIDEALQTLRTNREAVARVDVVGHSMGGVIARTLANDPRYYENTFEKGLIRRLVTLGTPHHGSPWANLLWILHSLPVSGLLWDLLADRAGKPINQGAIEDLQVGSAALQAMSTTNVPAFALIGDLNPYLEDLGAWIDVFYDMLRFFGVTIEGLDTTSRGSLVNSLMNSASSDWVVLGTSQRGGLDDQYAQRTESTFHTQEPGSSEMGATARDLLKGDVGQFSSGFPPTWAPVAIPNGRQATQLSKIQRLSGTQLVTITSPPPNSVFNSGEAITITAVPVGGVNVAAALIIMNDGSNQSALVESAPFTATFNIANDFVGTLRFTVAARDDQGNMSVAEGTAKVKSLATLESISLTPSPVNFSSVATSRQLVVTGHYSDAVDRNITDPGVGTTYSSADSGVVTVNASGRVTAAGAGDTLITVKNGSTSTQGVAHVARLPPNAVSVTPATVIVGGVAQPLKIQGMYLGGANQIRFLNGSVPDTSITAGNIVVDELGLTLTTTLSVDQTAAEGSRTVVVTTPGGSSSSVADAGNQISSRRVTPPTVSTGAAGGITQTGATLNGTVNPNLASTDTGFEYGPTTAYGTTAPAQTLSGFTLQAISASISSLACNTTYHFRAVGTNSAGTRFGADNTFATPVFCPPPPTVTTDAATGFTQTGGTLNGTINPNLGVTNRRFEYGLTAAYGSTSPNLAIGSGNVGVGVSYVVTRLACNTLYHYRAVGQNGGGVANGGDLTFTTAACPPVGSNNILALTAQSLPMNSASQDSMSNVRAETWYRVRLFALRSYQISAWPVDHEQGADAPSLDLSIFSDYAGTVTATPTPSVSSGGLEGSPNSNGDALPTSMMFRPTASGVYKIRILRSSGGTLAHFINVAVRETTLFSPWTSRAAGFEGFVEMHNNTNAPVSVTLRGYDSTGRLRGAGLSLTLQPNATDFRTAAQIGVPVNVFAGIVLTHNGAFGTIAANITTLNGANGLSFDSRFTERSSTVAGLPVR